MTERKYGLIFKHEDNSICKKLGIESDSDAIEKLLVPWDYTEQPSIIQFDGAWRDFLKREAAQNNEIRSVGVYRHFWQIYEGDIDELFGTIQKQNDCAAWAATRCCTSCILHQIYSGAEQVAERLNQMALYAYSSDYELKAGSRIPNGGRTLDAVAAAGNTIGNAPASIAGDYDGAVTFTGLMNSAKSEAAKRQVGWALYNQTGISQTVDDIFLSLAADRPVLIGNLIAVQDGTAKDKNGVYIGRVNGSGWGGGHATSFLDYQIVNGTEYAWWGNSHGNIYPAEDGSPDWGCWLTRESVRKLVNSSYFDCIFTTWSEAKKAEPNYNLNL